MADVSAGGAPRGARVGGRVGGRRAAGETVDAAGVPRAVAFTSGAVAKMCAVAPRTVNVWCDEGRLGCVRLPGSRDRRIPLAALVAFLRGTGMEAVARDALNAALARLGRPPYDGSAAPPLVLCWGVPAAERRRIPGAAAVSGFDLARRLWDATAVVVGPEDGGAAADLVLARVRACRPGVPAVRLLGDDAAGDGVRAGCDWDRVLGGRV